MSAFFMPFLAMHNNKKASIISHNSNFFDLWLIIALFLTMRNHRNPKIFDNAQG